MRCEEHPDVLFLFLFGGGVGEQAIASLSSYQVRVKYYLRELLAWMQSSGLEAP